MRGLLIRGIRLYRFCLSPFLPNACRFHPTCSEYAIQALGSRGAVRGGYMAIRRVLKCHPLGPHGFDPVE